MALISCCNVLFPDENLTIKRKDYTGNELRTDGYYYYFNESTNVTVIYFFYRNGVILLVDSYFGTDLGTIEKEIVNAKFNPKSNWGVFIIDNNYIQYERWVGSLSSAPKAFISKSTGYILNDTTLHFTQRYDSEQKETRIINEVWHFKQFFPKPDSTNVYIK